MTFLADLGLGEYTRDYLGPRRYETLCCGSFGHSVPVIAGQGQCAGKGYRCTGFAAQADGRVRMELQAAYPAGLVKRLVRSFAFDLATGDLRVWDTFEKPAGPVEENLITQICPQLTPAGILLQQNGSAALLQIWTTGPGEADENARAKEQERTPKPEKAATPGAKTGTVGLQIRVLRLTHRNHAGQDEPVYAIRWEVPLLDGRGGFCIRYLT